MSSVTTVLAAHYAKHTAQNPRDTIYANMQRAVDDFPEIATAPELLGTLECATACLESTLKVLTGGAKEMIEMQIAQGHAAIAKARGQE